MGKQQEITEPQLESSSEDILGTEKVSKLICVFAIPSIVAMVVGALYNIVDQIFIGNAVGELGNAATNVAFPFTNMCLSLSLMLGIGGAAAFNLKMGEGKKEEAPYYFGNAISMLFIAGGIMLVVSELFLEPLLLAFGATDTVMPFAKEYVTVVAIGFPFAAFSVGAGHLLRADGRPNLTMGCNILGAVINIGLDALFVPVLGWGMAGAAWATIIGQLVATVVQLIYLMRPKTFKAKREHYFPRVKYFVKDMKLGLASCINQLTLILLQIVVNNTLKYYGAMSIYGADIAIAIAGIAMKVNSLFVSIVIGLAQGNQPIMSFNYGAKKLRRVKEAYFRTAIIGFLICIVGFIIYQTIPEMVIGIFGNGSELYMEFGVIFLRRFLLLSFGAFVPILTTTTFSSIGKPWKGTAVSLARQVIFFVPFMLILPYFFGLEGAMYAPPLADCCAIVFTVIMIIVEFRRPEFRKEKGVLKEIFTRKPAV